MKNSDLPSLNYERRFQIYLRRRWWWRRPNLYLIAAAPKSGSTWAATLLSQILELPLIFAFDLPDESEHKLTDLFLKRKGVVQQHCRWCRQTKIFIEELKIKSVVLVRNLPDTIISVRDHLRKENTGNWPWGRIDPEIISRSDGELQEFLIDHIAPWYISFFAGWSQSGYPIVTYDQALSNPSAFLEQLGIRKSNMQILQALEKTRNKFTRLNVGRAGRGKEELSQNSMARLKDLADHYRHLDLTPLGL